MRLLSPLVLWPPFGSSEPPPEDLFEAIALLASADAELAASFGAAGFLWLERAPDEVALPYAVLSQIDEPGELGPDSPGSSGAASWVEVGEFRVTVYAAGRVQARTLARQIADAIEAADAIDALGHLAATPLYVRRDGRGFDQLDPDLGPNGEDVWSHTLAYRAVEAGPT